MHASSRSGRASLLTLQQLEWVFFGERIKCFASTSHQQRSHYEILGVEHNADAKQIKAAFYELSKKYHPDKHADQEAKNAAAEKFQEVVSAYEILGSEGKRREYDAKFLQQPLNVVNSRAYQRAYDRQSQKSYFDLDIDYKTFEQFQRSTRRRRNRNDYYRMPDEFFAEFGGREFKSFYQGRWPSDTVRSNYSDERTAFREAEERRLWKEVEEENRKRTAHLPPLDLPTKTESQGREEFKSSFQAGLVIIVVSLIALTLQR